MVDDNEKKDQFEFDPSGEAVEYIPLEQAQLVAMRTAVEQPGNYGPRSQGIAMVFDLVEQEERCWLSTEMGRKVNGDFELISRAL